MASAGAKLLRSFAPNNRVQVTTISWEQVGRTPGRWVFRADVSHIRDERDSARREVTNLRGATDALRRDLETPQQAQKVAISIAIEHDSEALKVYEQTAQMRLRVDDLAGRNVERVEFGEQRIARGGEGLAADASGAEGVDAGRPHLHGSGKNFQSEQ